MHKILGSEPESCFPYKLHQQVQGCPSRQPFKVSSCIFLTASQQPPWPEFGRPAISHTPVPVPSSFVTQVQQELLGQKNLTPALPTSICFSAQFLQFPMSTTACKGLNATATLLIQRLISSKIYKARLSPGKSNFSLFLPLFCDNMTTLRWHNPGTLSVIQF